MTNSEHSNRIQHEQLDRTLLTDGDYIANESVDLTNCDKEPIHIPGLIQPHGVLLAFTDDPSRIIVNASRNTLELLGRPAEELLGMPITELLGEPQLRKLLEHDDRTPDTAQLRYSSLNIPVNGLAAQFTAIIHESDGLLILELEASQNEQDAGLNDFEWIQTFFTRIKQAANRTEASQIAAEQIKIMLEYDRVMVYEFDSNWNGKVIAEAKNRGLEPFLGHHYPASDIPKQARALYLRNWLRTIVDVHYEPVEVIPALNPLTEKPLNLSLSVLRSVSPMHIEYLHNMGVGATMTISLIHNQQLWGLITCHHYSAKYVSHRVRKLCNFLGAFFSNEFYQRQQLDDYEAELRLKSIASRISALFIGDLGEERVHEALAGEQHTILELMEATGAAVMYGGKLSLFGNTPGGEDIRQLHEWTLRRLEDKVFYSSQLSLDNSEAHAYKHEASGMMFLPLSEDNQDFIMWFRPELVRVVDWAGDPAKSVIQENDGVRLSPRKSFEKWRQVVAATSMPWKPREIRLLSDLKAISLQRSRVQLQQAEEQARIHAQQFKENENRYLNLMNQSPVAFLAIKDGRIAYANARAAQLLQTGAPEALLNRDLAAFAGHSARAAFKARFNSSNISEPLVSFHETLITDLNETLQLEFTIALVINDGVATILTLLRDAADHTQQDLSFTDTAQQLKEMIHTDPLTELPNRRRFYEDLSDLWGAAEDTGAPLSLIVLDLDNFKLYNEINGYQGGNLCLQWVANVLIAVEGLDMELIYRYDGEAFAVLLPETDIVAARSIAERIRAFIASAQIYMNPGASEEVITVSLGVASLEPSSSLNKDKLVSTAENALLAAKAKGKNGVEG
jgi:chemotaxis family two-component system sensor kinase Cph1